MAKVICSISGLTLKVTHIPLTVEAGIMAHPIFYVPQKQLLSLYRRYTKGDLNGIDSYLLYLALAYSTDSLLFACPAKYRERTTDKLVANTIDRLVTIIWQSDIIQHPSFKQPKYIINERNATSFLTGMPTWIEAWEHNIKLFKAGRIHQRYEKRLKQVEEKLSKVILSGTSGTHLALNVANWASIAGEFPEDKIDKWKETIRKCYNPENRNKRRKTERFKYYKYKEIIARDKASLDIFWLKDDSLDDLDNLPPPDILQQEIIDHLEAALNAFRDVASGLPVSKK